MSQYFQVCLDECGLKAEEVWGPTSHLCTGAPRLELRVCELVRLMCQEAGAAILPSGYWCLYDADMDGVRAHTCKYTPRMCKSLIFMHFLFREKRKYLLSAKHCINHFMLKRK